MAGLMGVTAFLSMWINNSAATSIMLPVALAITDELQNHSKGLQERKNTIKEAAAAVNGKAIIDRKKNIRLITLIFDVEVLDLTKINQSSKEEVILNALHIEEPYVSMKIHP
jgi:di/tricarboxylate transporter